MALVRQMTADEYLAIPYGELPRWAQLIEGDIVVTEPDMKHQRALVKILVALENWVTAAPGRGRTVLPLDVKIDEHNVYGPDLLWYAADRSLPETRPYPVPDLVVEARSPSTWRYDTGVKRRRYEEAGLAELWLVDTEEDEVRVLARSAPGAPAFDVERVLRGGDVLTSPQLPGFALAVADVFATG